MDKAVILAGGLGKRLEPFTRVIPKPLLPVGESSVLEIQIRGLARSGVKEVFVATNYMAEYVQAFLGNGDKYGVALKFSKELEPLGTCGPVVPLKDELTDPFVLMNGDILTTLDFRRLIEFARVVSADLIVGTKHIVAPFNFGKVIAEHDFIVDIEEKPDFRFEILAGIYVLKPPVLDIIPPRCYYGIDMLIKDMLARGMRVARFEIADYWLDIGQMSDYQIAQEAYKEHFQSLAG